MKGFAKTVRTLFGIQASVQVILFAAFLYYVSRFSDVLGTGAFKPKYVFGAFLVLSIPCTLSGIAWYRLKYELPKSQVWLVLASLASLLFPVLGLATFVLGMWTYGRPPAKPKRPPKHFPADDTNRYIQLVVTFLSILAWMAGAFYWHEWGERQQLKPVYDWGWWVQLALAVFASVLMHEMGHAFAGRLTAMTPYRLQLGPLLIHFENGRKRYGIRLAGLFGSVGATEIVPLDLNKTRGRLAFMAMGGPLLSLLCGAGCTVLTLSAKGNVWEHGWEFFAIASACGWSHLFFSLIPISSNKRCSDGAMIRELLRTGPWANVHVAFAMQETSGVTEIRPRDWDITVIEQACAFVSAGIKALELRKFAYIHYLDSDQTGEARRCLAAAEALYPMVAKKAPALLHADFVYFHALYNRDRRKAEMWWERMEAKQGGSNSADYYKAYAALRLAQNRIPEAREACAKGLEYAESMPDVGLNLVTRDDLKRMQLALENYFEPIPMPEELNAAMIR